MTVDFGRCSAIQAWQRCASNLRHVTACQLALRTCWLLLKCSAVVTAAVAAVSCVYRLCAVVSREKRKFLALFCCSADGMFMQSEGVQLGCASNRNSGSLPCDRSSPWTSADRLKTREGVPHGMHSLDQLLHLYIVMMALWGPF